MNKKEYNLYLRNLAVSASMFLFCTAFSLQSQASPVQSNLPKDRIGKRSFSEFDSFKVVSKFFGEMKSNNFTYSSGKSLAYINHTIKKDALKTNCDSISNLVIREKLSCDNLDKLVMNIVERNLVTIDYSKPNNLFDLKYNSTESFAATDINSKKQESTARLFDSPPSDKSIEIASIENNTNKVVDVYSELPNNKNENKNDRNYISKNDEIRYYRIFDAPANDALIAKLPFSKEYDGKEKQLSQKDDKNYSFSVVSAKKNNLLQENVEKINTELVALNLDDTNKNAVSPQSAPVSSPVIDVEVKKDVPLKTLLQSSLPENSSGKAPVPPLPIQAQPIIVNTIKAEPKLSSKTKEIINKIPPEKPQSVVSTKPIEIQREHKSPLEDNDVKKHTGIGVEMSVTKPKANINRLLDDAYNYLMAGNQEKAIDIYKQVLHAQPNNKLALFGLATTYHRAGQLELARPLYGKLIAIDPKNVEGLNNFLVLISDESPNEALFELEKLYSMHANFSPISAQMAIIYTKIGQYDKALEKMKIATDLSPGNLKYRYNMAVIYDKIGDWDNAAKLYQLLITASERGKKISVDIQEIQERLTFIVSNKEKRN
ncbi:MAG: tetratricopeptide repeat protein [Pseudomonadota bacterium]